MAQHFPAADLKGSTFFTILITPVEYLRWHEINPKDVSPELIYPFSSHSGGLNVQIEILLLIKVNLTIALAPVKRFTVTEDGWHAQGLKRVFSSPRVEKDRCKGIKFLEAVFYHLCFSWNQNSVFSSSAFLPHQRILRVWSSSQRTHSHIAAGFDSIRIQSCKPLWLDLKAHAVRPNTEAWPHASLNFQRSVHLHGVCGANKMLYFYP